VCSRGTAVPGSHGITRVAYAHLAHPAMRFMVCRHNHRHSISRCRVPFCAPSQRRPLLRQWHTHTRSHSHPADRTDCHLIYATWRTWLAGGAAFFPLPPYQKSSGSFVFVRHNGAVNKLFYFALIWLRLAGQLTNNPARWVLIHSPWKMIRWARCHNPWLQKFKDVLSPYHLPSAASFKNHVKCWWGYL